MKDSTWTTLGIITGITILELFWIGTGHNGQSLAVAIAAIGAVGGYAFKGFSK